MRGIFTRSAAVAVLMAGTMLAQTAPPAAQPPPRHAYRLQQLGQVLELTPDQQNQAQVIMQRAMTTARPLVQQLKQNRQQINRLIESGNTAQFNQQIQQFATAQGNLVAQLAVIRANAMEQFYTMLNPQQRQRAVALHNLMMGHMMGHRRHFGGEGCPPE